MVLSFSLHFITSIRYLCFMCFFFQAEDGIRDLVRSRGLGDVYKRQRQRRAKMVLLCDAGELGWPPFHGSDKPDLSGS